MFLFWSFRTLFITWHVFYFDLFFFTAYFFAPKFFINDDKYFLTETISYLQQFICQQ
jgi:hypothetical protein